MRCGSMERDTYHLRTIYRENSAKYKIPKTDESFIRFDFLFDLKLYFILDILNYFFLIYAQ